MPGSLRAALKGVTAAYYLVHSLADKDFRNKDAAAARAFSAAAAVPGGNPVLVFAAVLLGLVVGLQHRAGGGVLAPILTHVTWSSTMLFVLPPIFAA